MVKFKTKMQEWPGIKLAACKLYLFNSRILLIFLENLFFTDKQLTLNMMKLSIRLHNIVNKTYDILVNIFQDNEHRRTFNGTFKCRDPNYFQKSERVISDILWQR